MEDNPCLRDVVDLIRNGSPIGCVGRYSGVYEISTGVEGFTPEAESNPSLGSLGQAERVPTISLVTYAPMTALSAVEKFTNAVQRVHPWEHPVIEVQAVKLWYPSIDAALAP